MSGQATLYGITTSALCADSLRLTHGVRAALRGGLRWLQYRHKHASTDTARRQARRLQWLCRSFDATLIINDRLWLAEELGVGLHLGRGDTSIAEARQRLGTDAIIGASCQGDIDYAMDCLLAGASYVSIGRLFASTTKPTAPSAPLQCLCELRARTDARVCAIGGIGVTQLNRVADAGADLIAVGGALFDVDDVGAATAQLLQCLSESTNKT